MLNAYLRSLSAVEVDRILTRKMEPFALTHGPDPDSPGCLIGVVRGVVNYTGWDTSIDPRAIFDVMSGIGTRYNDLCRRLGTERANAAIRERALRYQARRTVLPVLVTA